MLFRSQAARILADLYYAEPRTPLEEYMDAGEVEGDEADREEDEE